VWTMIAGSFGRYVDRTARDHGKRCGRAGRYWAQ
jgi:hypothetical protein